MKVETKRIDLVIPGDICVTLIRHALDKYLDNFDEDKFDKTNFHIYCCIEDTIAATAITLRDNEVPLFWKKIYFAVDRNLPEGAWYLQGIDLDKKFKGIVYSRGMK